MHGKLTARAAATTKPGRYGDGGGLWLVVSKTGARKWVFRFTFERRVTEMGLGNGVVSLAEARRGSEEARRLLAAGRNPIKARDDAKRQSSCRPTFGAVVEGFLAAKEGGWRNEKHRAQWRMTLERYAAPLWDVPVDEVNTAGVLGVLQPIWTRIPETASRLRGRIESVLDSARAKGHIHRNEINPARWRGHLDAVLPRARKLTRGHHAALPFDEVPALFQQLKSSRGVAAEALKFTILTAARTNEALGAEWGEFDLKRSLWAVPPTRMKSGREHRVPLSAPVMKLLEDLGNARESRYVFPGVKPDRPLSNMSMDMLLRRLSVNATVHGFRSSFRDWCGEASDFPREVAEAALSHVIGDQTERAYRRGDALEKRRALMDLWAAHVTSTRRPKSYGFQRLSVPIRFWLSAKSSGDVAALTVQSTKDSAWHSALGRSPGAEVAPWVIASLLRCSDPIPQWARNSLAELMDPVTWQRGVKLVLKKSAPWVVKDWLSTRERELRAVDRMLELRRLEGLSVQVAASRVSDEIGVDERTVTGWWSRHQLAVGNEPAGEDRITKLLARLLDKEIDTKLLERLIPPGARKSRPRKNRVK